ncbi:MAG: dockerin type I repeat-containing protein, partial [Planctomycetota bacterium]
CAATSCSGSTCTASGPSAGFLEGDLDGNGSFELADLRSLLDYLGRGTRAPACLAAADLDGDGRITPGDSVIIAMRLSEEGAETIGGRPLIAHHRALGLPCETACP